MDTDRQEEQKKLKQIGQKKMKIQNSQTSFTNRQQSPSLHFTHLQDIESIFRNRDRYTAHVRSKQLLQNITIANSLSRPQLYCNASRVYSIEARQKMLQLSMLNISRRVATVENIKEYESFSQGTVLPRAPTRVKKMGTRGKAGNRGFMETIQSKLSKKNDSDSEVNYQLKETVALYFNINHQQESGYDRSLPNIQCGVVRSNKKFNLIKGLQNRVKNTLPDPNNYYNLLIEPKIVERRESHKILPKHIPQEQTLENMDTLPSPILPSPLRPIKGSSLFTNKNVMQKMSMNLIDKSKTGKIMNQVFRTFNTIEDVPLDSQEQDYINDFYDYVQEKSKIKKNQRV